ncbi:MAG: hypothetical protein CM15mV75_020 [uncultured marine virus]|nr:MAG: hypothetical protein CM15mV75_020 [uncultured marine virus]
MTQKKRTNPLIYLHITKLTLEQDLKLRQLEIMLAKPETRKEDIATVMIALQEQAFVLSNCIENLIKKWPKPPTTKVPRTTDEVPLMFGLLLETKDSDFTSET